MIAIREITPAFQIGTGDICVSGYPNSAVVKLAVLESVVKWIFALKIGVCG